MNLPDGQNGPFEHFFITNSNPRITDKLPRDDCFQVLNPKPRDECSQVLNPRP